MCFFQIFIPFLIFDIGKNEIVTNGTFKVEECNEPTCEALIFPYGVVLFNIFSTICI